MQSSIKRGFSLHNRTATENGGHSGWLKRSESSIIGPGGTSPSLSRFSPRLTSKLSLASGSRIRESGDTPKILETLETVQQDSSAAFTLLDATALQNLYSDPALLCHFGQDVEMRNRILSRRLDGLLLKAAEKGEDDDDMDSKNETGVNVFDEKMNDVQTELDGDKKRGNNYRKKRLLDLGQGKRSDVKK
ncbi:unnamed protein product [Protopolystoma xenopodis]|uniref:Uncharacterized protein n=1 Tax=Protopolystoma xenopodis TaxID=117903 RepID=A0A3S5FBU8_9PLAT|nr:unnamed protein product [Protopolystoma xenopodis]